MQCNEFLFLLCHNRVLIPFLFLRWGEQRLESRKPAVALRGRLPVTVARSLSLLNLTIITSEL